MSRRKRHSAAAITLFSFQDIIMSTSGIMIMIVLLLSLELIQNRGAAGSPEELVDTARVQAEIQQVRQEIEDLEKTLKSSDQFIQTASRLTATELNERLDEFKEQNLVLAQELKALQSEMHQRDQLEPQLAARRRELQRAQRTLAEAHVQAATLKQEIQSVVQQDHPTFTLPRGSRQNGWLIDIAANQIQAAPIGQAARPIIFSATSRGVLGTASPDSAFLDWTQTQPSGRAYFFLMVRPRGVEVFNRITKRFNQDQTSYGYDLIGADQMILDPEKGAMR